MASGRCGKEKAGAGTEPPEAAVMAATVSFSPSLQPGPSAILSIFPAAPSPSRSPRSSFPPPPAERLPTQPGPPRARRSAGARTLSRPRGPGRAAPVSGPAPCFLRPPSLRTWNLLPDPRSTPGPTHVPSPRVPRLPASRGVGGKPFDPAWGTEARNLRNPRTPPNLAKPVRPLPRPRSRPRGLLSWHPRLYLPPSPPPPFFSKQTPGNTSAGPKAVLQGVSVEVTELPASPPPPELRAKKRWPNRVSFVPPGLSGPGRASCARVLRE